MPTGHSVTELLARIRQGDPDAESNLFNHVNSELHCIAERLMAGERRKNHSLQPTALLNEAVLRLIDHDRAQLRRLVNRKHFYFAVTRSMRQILIEHERRRNARDKEGRWTRQPPETFSAMAARDESADMGLEDASWDALLDKIRGKYGVGFAELCDAVDQLAADDDTVAQIVWLRFMASMTLSEIAEVLETTEASVSSNWRLAVRWLRFRLKRKDD